MPSNRSTVAASPKWTIVLPTYRRQDVLQVGLEHISNQTIDLRNLEVLVYDNGTPKDSRSTVEPFERDLRVTYCLNEGGHGLGYSLCRGAAEASGEIIVEINDDAHIPPDFLACITRIFESDPEIGVVGVRAIESGYKSDSRKIGSIDLSSTDVVGNFNQPTEGLVEVDHVYGFCYAYRRELLKKGGGHDQVLLAQDYSSGNRIETDHCLSARALGYKVVYDGSISVLHLAKPRPDLDERSLRWKSNHWRNTLYLYLKHFGMFGGHAIAIRFACQDVGAISLLRRPDKTNWLYFWTGFRARASAVYHWGKLRLSQSISRPTTRTKKV